MRAEDLLELAPCNLDPLTETYNAAFYLEYLARWPYCCYVLVGPDDEILFGDLADGADDNADSRSVPADDGRPPNIEGYILGKLESSPPPNMPSSEPYDPDTNTNIHYLPWHAHVTALSVAPSARRAGAARKLTAALEAQGDASRAWFVDLYVRSDNAVAITLYRGMGYVMSLLCSCAVIPAVSTGELSANDG